MKRVFAVREGFIHTELKDPKVLIISIITITISSLHRA